MCYSLFTKHRFEARMKPHQAPEMVRVPLEELVLQIKTLGCAGLQRLGGLALWLVDVPTV